MTEHAVWHLPGSHFKVWISILNLVNHKDADWWDGVSRITIPAGSFVTSQEKLAEYSGTSRQAVRAAFVSLTKIGSISTKIATKRYTHIFVTNWSGYSGEDSLANQESNQRPTQDQPSANQAPTITGEGREGKAVKKDKKSEKNIYAHGFDRFWNLYPRKVKKPDAMKAWNEVAPQNGLLEIILRAVIAQKDSRDWLQENGRYIPYPASWLRGRRWEDELPLMESMAARLWREAQEEKHDAQRSDGHSRSSVPTGTP